jgi:DNA-binding SARP family transcriptional activator/Tfp pilus assembly protein PilF
MSEHEILLRLLGPVEIRRGSSWRRVPAAQQCTLLAILAANLGIPVSADRLIDDLWPAGPPRNPANQLQVLVYRLRHALGDDDAGLLQTRGFGYALMMPASQTDIGQFESLAARAAAALRENRPDAADELCTQGLELWRAEPFADARVPASLAAELTRLTEERLVLHETQVDARLQLGRHAELVSELQQATVSQPFRERYWAQLMLCYYRSGRQAEAFDAYRRVYQLLADEIGAEPGQELQRLHQRMLAADPSLLDPLVAQSRHTHVIPRQLPGALRHFSGRAAELTQLAEIAETSRATAEPTLIVITGPGGIGKTALAVYWAHWSASQFPDGHLYLNLRGFDPTGQPMSAGESIGDLLFALGVIADRLPPTGDAKVALYRSLMADQRMLLILDNARDAAQVRPLLPGMASCVVIVTSRNPLAGLVAVEGAHVISLDVLSAAEAHDVFSSYLGVPRVAAEPEAAATVARQCAYLPLALAVAASRAAVVPRLTFASLAADLNDARQRLDTLSAGEELTDVKAVLSWSYRGSSAAARRMFRLLSVHPGPEVSVEAAARLADVSVGRARRLLSELAATRLITETGSGRYRFHDLLRTYSSDLALAVETARGRDTALRHLLDYYLHACHQAALHLEPDRSGEIQPGFPYPGPDRPGEIRPGSPPAPAFTGPRGAFAWFTAEYRVLLRIVEAAASSGYPQHTWQLGWALTDYFRRSGQWHDWMAVQRVALTAAERLRDPSAQGHAHRSLARAYCWLGKYDDGRRHLRRALALFSSAGNELGQGHVHRNLAYVYERLGDDDQALKHAELALHCYQHAGHAAGAARALNTVGWYRAKRGDYRMAIDSCTEALLLLQGIGHRSGEAATWDSLGYARHRMGEFAEAVTCFENALEILTEIGDRDAEADSLAHLAEALDAAGESGRACQTWQRALAILTDLNHPDAEAIRARLRSAGVLAPLPSHLSTEIHSVLVVTADSTSGRGSTPIPGAAGTRRWPSSRTNGSVMSVW